MNINNDGLVYYDGENFYYSNITSDGGKLYKQSADFKNKEKLSDINDIKYINKHNSYIYYVSKNSIYRLNLNTKENKIIFIHDDEYEWIFNMTIFNNRMFFSTGDEDSTQYMMDLETLSVEKLFTNAYGINIEDNIIYYSGNKEKGIYSFDLNSKEFLKIANDNVSYPIIKDDYLYYFNFEEESFYRLDLNDNFAKEKVINLNRDIDSFYVSPSDFNISSNNLIYAQHYLFKVVLITKKITQINNISSDSINIVNDEIWFRGYIDDEFKLYKMDLSGNDLMVIE
ncbi:DUF5050 domain-containing protein [Tissierellaceae bacterium HCP3S3_D8]